MKVSVVKKCLKIALIAVTAQFSVIPFSQAGEWVGETSRRSSDVDTLCVELDEKASPHLQKICLDKISVKWTLKTTEQSSLVRSSIHWKLQPALWLRGEGDVAGKRPLKSFNATIQAAYQATTPTDINLAAFFYPEVNSAPDDIISATDNLGIAIEFEADVLSKSGDGYSFNAPSSPDWGALLIDAPKQVPCILSDTIKPRTYIPSDVSKVLLRNGMSLSGLTICQVSFADLKKLNAAIQKTCTQCNPGVGPTVADKGISLDDLLRGVDDGAPAGWNENNETVLAASNTTSTSLDDILGGVEEEIAASRRKKAHETQQRAMQVASANAAASCKSLQNTLLDLDAQVTKKTRKLCKSSINLVNEAIGHHKRAINRSTTRTRYSYSRKAHEDLAELEDCIGDRRQKLLKLTDSATETQERLIGEQCINPDGIADFSEARDEFTKSVLAQLDRLNGLYENAEDVIDELDDIEARNLTRLDAAASQNAAALTQSLSASDDWMGREVGDSAAKSSALMQRHFLKSAPPAQRRSSNNPATFSYPETTRSQNNTISIDNGVSCNIVDEAARIACLSNNRRPAKAQKPGSSAKTQ